jgi:hypothetical protein
VERGTLAHVCSWTIPLRRLTVRAERCGEVLLMMMMVDKDGDGNV